MTAARQQEILSFDRAHVWHPYTSAVPDRPSRLVVSAEGARLRLADGRELVDGTASWWAAIHGYRHPALDAAVTGQLGRVSGVMFGGLTHEPAVHVARHLLELTDPALQHVFFADSGSSAVDVALKMCLQRAGRRGGRFLALRGGFHGDTFGAMSVGDPELGAHGMFTPALPRHVFAPLPPAGPELADDHPDVVAWTAATRALAAEHADELVAVIAEPMLQSARGMRVYAPGCLKALRRLADELGVPLVLDEVASGFGRTGRMFAAEHAGVTGDVVCVGKALTGGYLSLAAVLCTTEVATAVGTLLHGPTYTANPLACAVAAANLGLLATGGWRYDVARISAHLDRALSPLRTAPEVRGVQVFGAFAAVRADRALDLASAVDAAVEAGAWLRPFRDVVYVMPPYVTTDEELEILTTAVTAALRAGLGR